jgi:hypothetical protein
MEKLERRPYSRPAFERSLKLETEIAQRFVEREYPKVEYALYHFEVVLRVMGDAERADYLEKLAVDMVDTCLKAIEKETQRINKLRQDNGILDRPVYGHPGIHRILIASPLGHQFLALVQQLDELMISLDALWLLGVLSNQQRANAIYQWQRIMLRLSRRIRGIPARGIRRMDDSMAISAAKDALFEVTQASASEQGIPLEKPLETQGSVE